MAKKKGVRISLRGKLLYPVVIALALFMGISALALSFFLTDAAEETFVSMLSAGNEILVKNIRNVSATYRSLMKAISANPQFQFLSDVAGRSASSFVAPIPDIYRDSVWSKAEMHLQTLADIFPDVSQFSFALRNGDVIASSQKETIGKLNVAENTWFARALGGKTVISPPLMSLSTGEKSVIIAAPVYDSSGDIGGVVYAVLSCLRVVSDTIRNVKMSKTGYAYIVDGESGLMVAHNTWSKILTDNVFKSQPWMKTLGPDDRGVRKDYVDREGNRRLAVYHKEPISGWIAVSCISTEELERRKTFIRGLIFALTIGGAIVAGLVISFVQQSTTNDLHRVRNFAKEVAGGKLDSIIVMNRNDEIGDLGDDIAVMVRSLKRHVQKEIRDTEERRKEFAALRDALMLTLAGLVESRDSSTGQHIRKTSAYVKIITYSLKDREDFKDAADLLAAILAKGVAQQIKQGLHREYVEKHETPPFMRGKLDLPG
ncbi:MAG: Cache 3/Cache 2 fusion domain-containing protein, partial [Desulfovibrio sp.]|nr:Cache 3/Cache 2 fusion domain-containing protein [Desulfovibrio sp.]